MDDNQFISLILRGVYFPHNITSPDASPNFIYIPHIIDSYVAKSISTNGLKSQDLYNAVYEAFCKKPQQTKEQIKKAHKTIKPSSN